MQACLKEQIGCNVKVYVDDIFIKTSREDSLLNDLHETFANLDRYNIKLNQKKCSFGIPTCQLLGYLISERGLTCHLATLSRFIGKLGEKAFPFYQLLRKTDKFT
jgi:hypothetical protein